MNKVELIGRLTKDPELKQTQNETVFCNFTVAIDRRYKDANGNRQADFINCTAWRQTATFIQKYFKKGNRIGICGCIQTRSYEEDDGRKVFITEVIAEEAEFVENNKAETAEAPAPEAPAVATSGSEQKDLPFEI